MCRNSDYGACMALLQDRFDLAKYCRHVCMSCELIVSSQFRKESRGQLQHLVASKLRVLLQGFECSHKVQASQHT